MKSNEKNKEIGRKKVPYPTTWVERTLIKELVCVLNWDVIHKVTLQPKH